MLTVQPYRYSTSAPGSRGHSAIATFSLVSPAAPEACVRHPEWRVSAGTAGGQKRRQSLVTCSLVVASSPGDALAYFLRSEQQAAPPTCTCNRLASPVVVCAVGSSAGPAQSQRRDNTVKASQAEAPPMLRPTAMRAPTCGWQRRNVTAPAPGEQCSASKPHRINGNPSRLPPSASTVPNSAGIAQPAPSYPSGSMASWGNPAAQASPSRMLTVA